MLRRKILIGKKAVEQMSHDVPSFEGYSSAYSDEGLLAKVKKVAAKAGGAVLHRALVLKELLKDPALTAVQKTQIIAALGYFISPVDAVPDFIPVAGYADDLAVLIWVSKRVAKLTTQAHLDAATELLRRWLPSFRPEPDEVRLVEGQAPSADTSAQAESVESAGLDRTFRRLLSIMAGVDGRVDAQELQAIEGLVPAAAEPGARMAMLADAADVTSASAVLGEVAGASLGVHQKLELLNALAQVAIADGVVSPDEARLLSDAERALQLPPGSADCILDDHRSG